MPQSKQAMITQVSIKAARIACKAHNRIVDTALYEAVAAEILAGSVATAPGIEDMFQTAFIASVHACIGMENRTHEVAE
jgi:hypothetical protein